MRSHLRKGTIWVLKAMLVITTYARIGLKMMAAATSNGDLHYMIMQDSIKKREFLNRLMIDSNRKLFLI